VIARIGYDLVRATLRLAMALWPLWLFWFAWRGSNIAWRELLLTFHGNRDPGYLLAYRAWPSVALAGPVAMMVAALVAYRTQLAGRVMAYVRRCESQGCGPWRYSGSGACYAHRREHDRAWTERS